jgi:hypothetical protein
VSLSIGGVLDPEHWDKWEEAKAFLEPARRLGGQTELIRPDIALWVVLDGDELLAVATARITAEGCEVILVGGRDHRRWLGQLDQTIGAAAREAGALRMVACGRRGWVKSLTRLGWVKLGEANGLVKYVREL